MRFFHQAARRAAVLLLCLSMLTGMLIPAFAATTDPATETPAHNLVCTDNQDENHDPIYKVRLTDDGVGGGCGGGSGETEDGYVVAPIYAGATPEFRFGSEKPTEPVVLTVYERYEGEAAVVAKTYTLSELKALAQTEVVGYQHWKNGSEKVIAANLYATVSSLLADAGVEFGAGDAVIGLNPSGDTAESVRRVLTRFDEVRRRHGIPTQICVLAHVTTQMRAIESGAPADLIFQSIAGSQKGNTAFGFDAATIEQARQLALTQGTAEGPNVLYFETGQGSELSSEAHFGTDQVTMEARCYGFARHFSPFLVNTVVGFIGPEYLYDARQVLRAGLEDHFMGKLSGIPMGCDACYTNHMKADQNDIEKLAVLLTAAGCNYFMGIPHGDDVMLNYQTTGFRETAALRELFGLTAIAPFQRWLERMGFVENGKLTARAGDGSALL